MLQVRVVRVEESEFSKEQAGSAEAKPKNISKKDRDCKVP